MLSQHALQVVSKHALQQGGVLSQHALQVVSLHALQQGDGSAPGGGQVCSRGVCFEGGGLVETTPPDSHCCGRYASYWNAFLFPIIVWNLGFYYYEMNCSEQLSATVQFTTILPLLNSYPSNLLWSHFEGLL